MNTFRPTYWLFALLACALLAGAAAAPPFVGEGGRYLFMNSLGWFCHQIPERSFDVGGIHFALCHRCTGIVFGLVVGAAALVVLRIPEKLYARFARVALIVTIALNVIDWGVTIVGFWENTVISRTLAGALFGIVAGYVFARALAVPNQDAKQTPQSDLSFSTHPPT